jgi:hypothetical protein
MVQALTEFGGLNMFRIEHDTATGEVKEIPLTATEIKAIEKLQEEAAEKNAVMQAEAEAKAMQRQALLTRLGITEEEARILLGGN